MVCYSRAARMPQVLDRCPVVHLTNSPEDLGHLLRTLISKEQMLYAPLSALTLLSHNFKYGIESVQRQAIACLTIYYAETFEAWEGAKGFRAMPEAG
ncbi:hypothetical protein L226DRAFT_579840 [Lentinus tigrinus ALCF2SS1-7]|uniref:uncharacterized protein n=1 Tax=Lentinus tigrinus ALCF2SS1-7 TaxID=1328758 RepID=UPI001166058A|nr:hypothetical protein L226DRAFT_579840 [Lentinus tigrinus ALCF2SS1-7]